MQIQIKFLSVVFASCFLLVAGCGQLSTEYGKSSGPSARKSINGFGTLRSAFKHAGYKDRDMSRLTNRLMNETDVVVWTPQNDAMLNDSAVIWLDKWLARGKHTLIYISPDSGSEAEYWTTVAPLAPPEKRLEYRRRAAKSSNQRMMARITSPTSYSYPWFSVKPLPLPEKAIDAKGPWKLPGNAATDQPTASLEGSLGPGTQKVPPQHSNSTSTTSTTSATPATPATPASIRYKYRSLLETTNGNSYVGEVTSNLWSDSRIIVVSSGSLLTNFGLTQRANQQLADKIIQQATPKNRSQPQASFLTTNSRPIVVSDGQPGVPKASGMELLTVWPISLLTMHGIFLGLVICLMLLPIFGRPRRLSHNRRGNFGDHLDAVAALMKRAGGENYARSRISEYMKRMRGETSGPWVIDETSPPTPKPLPTLMSNRLSRGSSATTANDTQPNTVEPNTVEPNTVSKPPASQGPTANPTEPADSNHDGTDT